MAKNKKRGQLEGRSKNTGLTQRRKREILWSGDTEEVRFPRPREFPTNWTWQSTGYNVHIKKIEAGKPP